MMAEADCVALELTTARTSARVARHAVSRLAGSCGADVHAVALCVSEAVTNAIVHAYRDGPPGLIRVRAQVDHGDPAFLVEVEDDGVGMLPRHDSPGLGLGLPMIASQTTRLDVRAGDRGCCVSMWFTV